jgi:protein-tyrosine phosphatase
VTKLYWVKGPWPGKLALAARPRGGDWLRDDIGEWKQAGIETVVSLLTPPEQLELDLREEAEEVGRQGLEFTSLPIPDREVPRSETQLAEVLEKVTRSLSAGTKVVIHCRQGVGRTGLVAACLLVKSGMSPGAAVDILSEARGVSIPETTEQREWIDRYAPAFTK